MSLPDRDSQDLHLVQATEEELLQQQKNNSGEWKGALSLDAYLRREDLLFNQDLTKNGGLTPWMLVQGTGKERKVLAGCESIRKKALVARHGHVKDIVCHGIASVFCPSHYRGKGYAGRMMQDLGPTLRTWQAEDQECLFSVLYSDIGKDFYKARGWHPFPSAHVSLHPSSRSPADLPKVHLMTANDLADVCATDERLLRRRMSQLESTDKYCVALLPDIRTLKWHHAREDFVSNELYKKKPDIKGAFVVLENGDHVWCYWTRVWTTPQEKQGNTLHILRLVIGNEQDADFKPASEDGVSKARDSMTAKAIAALLAAAQSEATKWDMEEVEVWNPTSMTLAAAQILEPKSAIVHRKKESIASLQWYGDQPELPLEHVDWICNEKYGWC